MIKLHQPRVPGTCTLSSRPSSRASKSNAISCRVHAKALEPCRPAGRDKTSMVEEHIPYAKEGRLIGLRNDVGIDVTSATRHTASQVDQDPPYSTQLLVVVILLLCISSKEFNMCAGWYLKRPSPYLHGCRRHHSLVSILGQRHSLMFVALLERERHSTTITMDINRQCT